MPSPHRVATPARSHWPLVAAAAGLALFLLVVADLAWWGVTAPLDEAGARFMAGLAESTRERWNIVSDLVSYGIAIPAALAALGLLAWRRMWTGCLLVLAAFAVLAANDLLLKDLFGRPRPLPGRDTFAFPSGHTLTVTLLPAMVLVARPAWPAAWQARVPAAAVVAAWALVAALAGVLRILAGAHWPTDIVATWGLGAGAAAGLVWLAPRPSAGNAPPARRP